MKGLSGGKHESAPGVPSNALSKLRRRTMRSIRSKITAIAIAAILISMLTIVSAYYLMSEAEYDRQAAETMNLLAQNTQKTLEKTS